jgi:farnesyl diphosphate synthase
LDCYGDTEKTGKPGTDIENGKCNWLLVRALQLVTPQQRKILEESFGKSTDQVHAKRVKILYEVLDMKSKFDDFEARTLKDITEYSTEIDYYVNKEIFISLMNKIYKLGK